MTRRIAESDSAWVQEDLARAITAAVGGAMGGVVAARATRSEGVLSVSTRMCAGR